MKEVKTKGNRGFPVRTWPPVVAVLAVFFAAAGSAFAQQEPEKGSVEFRIGAGYTQPTYFTEKSPGYDVIFGGAFRVALAPESNDFFNRFGVFGAFEYTPVSSEEFDAQFFGRLKASESMLVVKTGFSVSIVRREKFEFLLNGGPAFVRKGFSLAAPHPRYRNQWQNVCRHLAEDACQSEWSVRGSLEPAIRIYPKGRESHFYLGASYDATMERIGFTIGASF